MNNIRLKELVVAVLCGGAIVASFLFWRTTTQAISEESFTSYGHYIASVGSLAIAASLFGIAAIFVQNAAVIYAAVAISIAIPFLFVSANSLTLAVMGCCIFLGLFSVRRIRKETSLSFGFNMANLFKAGVPLFLTVWGIIISLFYLNDVQKKDAIRTIFPRTAFDVTIRALGGPLRSLTGSESFTPDETVNQFFQGLVKKQLADRGINIDQISAGEMQRLLTQQRTEIARSYGIKLTGNEKLGDVFYTTIIERITDLLGPYREYVPYASALTFFLAFKTLSFFLYLAVLAIAFLLIKIMMMGGILIRKKE
ncbi:MAG: hypothetical protein U1A23_04055, partial [Candidatus Sungbacteria bacterium]|nr:hypothetical protein [Candidatus Sungbacteria bacterium]